MERRTILVDGNEAAASVAHRANEVIAIYPITPSSPMGEHADAWSAQGKTNIWGSVPDVMEMQSEGGASGAVHGSLQAGALTTTFTASQGLLLMIPNLFKIAGELTGTVFHIAARSVATHALSIFGDHSDVYACRQTGWGMLASANVQEVHDFALIAQAAAMRSRIPFLHFFDGFRTSHEIAKISELTDDDIRAMLPDELVTAHRARALDPDRPVLRGTAQNPDAFFQAREAVNPFYAACPAILQQEMDRFAELTGRAYRAYEYHGAPDAERVVMVMGSGVDTTRATVEKLVASGEKVGVLNVRMFRPVDGAALLAALPVTVKAIAALDRSKEPGALGEPLYLDVVTAVAEAAQRGELPQTQTPLIIGGRFGLSSKEFTPAMVRSIFDELGSDTPRQHFTVGINDDVSGLSLAYDSSWDIEPDDVVRAVFYGLGSDGTVGANKNSIKIIGTETDNYAQGYFVYDSKKAGAMTISHLRFGPRPLRAPYLVSRANFLACHQTVFLDKYDMVDKLVPGGTFLLNCPWSADEAWDQLPREVQQQLVEKRANFHIIDAYKVAREAGMGGRINTVMQTCFFAISGVLPRDEAIAKIKDAIRKTYGKKGDAVVKQNFAAVDAALAHLYEVKVPDEVTSTRTRPPVVPDAAPDFVKQVTAMMLAGKGDLLPVSAFTPDGTWPLGTTAWEKRNIAQEIPIWDPELCIQCNKCVFVCPHAAIRAKVYEPAAAATAPDGFQGLDYKGPEFPDSRYTIQVAPEDCTGCHLCAEVCPGHDKQDPTRKSLTMLPHSEHLAVEKANWAFFDELPLPDRTQVKTNVKGSQFLEPLFEFSGACAGCGETPYIKLMTQLFGDRALIANATGCSSIYGGNLPTVPYTVNAAGRGPAWSNSLFEDNAEFGFGFRLAVDAATAQAHRLLRELSSEIGDELTGALLEAAEAVDEVALAAQRERLVLLRDKLQGIDKPEARRLGELAGYLVPRSIWIVGGDGWAYDIGYGGLDHVIANHRDVNILVLDTEVYSNTGGQSSKATPLGAVAKFATSGKPIEKKDLGMIGITYGHVYVAQVAFGAKDSQTINAMREAAAYPGPSLIIAYSHCIEHGYDLRGGLSQQDKAVKSGFWPLYRFDPRRLKAGERPLKLDCKAPSLPFTEFAKGENRFQQLQKRDPERAQKLLVAAQRQINERWAMYEHLAKFSLEKPAED